MVVRCASRSPNIIFVWLSAKPRWWFCNGDAALLATETLRSPAPGRRYYVLRCATPCWRVDFITVLDVLFLVDSFGVPPVYSTLTVSE